MTFSIVARDPKTNAFGVATATGGPVVGSLVPHARACTGAIATQGDTNGLYAFDGLDRLAAPESDAETVLQQLLADDAGRDRRQCIIVDGEGRTAAWTGPSCTPHAGAITVPNVAAAGNMLTGPDVLEAMMAAFEQSAGAMEDRLLAALTAGQERGGDWRRIRSAALKVYSTEPFPDVDLRSDWSTAPIDDLATVLAATRDPSYADFFAGIPRRG
jgi:uncharacterized Ntn-hydrolase superfamily protein